MVKTNRATYLYNDAGDLVEKKDKEGKWLYEYFENGLLSKVIRPDKNEVTFQYDPLGRRIGKTYKDKTTKFLWDRNKVVHEWKEYQSDDEPEELKVLAVPKNIVTWLYKDGSFAPIGKLTENDSYSIITDHLGTPTEMYNSKGDRVWKVLRDIYGRERHKVGGETAETDCQIRYQGQYEDYETGLYYNRNRYYMPDEGMYSQRDLIGIAGGNPSLYGYVWDSTREVDVFGLALCPTDGIGNGNWLNAGLIDDLSKSGVKYNADDLLAITKMPSGKIVWLEVGNPNAGMEYILSHADDFTRKGINQEQIQELIMESLGNGKVVGYQGTGTGRPIYEVVFNGKTQHTAITVGSNGFIVGANPKTWP